MSFVYNNGVPASANSPSIDQPDMLTNTQSIESILNVDHIGFDAANGGRHRQVSMANQAAPAVPAGLNSVLFSNTSGGESVPFWQNSSGTLNIATYSGSLSIGASGYTRLPGGIIMQWQVIAGPTNGTTYNFPLAFPTNCFNVQLTGVVDDSSTIRIYMNASPTLTGFTLRSTASVNFTELHVLAIGN